MSETYPTRAELEAAGSKLRATYVGPLTLKYAQACVAELSQKTSFYADGQPIFPGLQIVRQDDGFNVVYLDQEPQPYYPTGNPKLDRLINVYGHAAVRDTNRGTKIYRGHTVSDEGSIDRMLDESWHDVDGWADGCYRQIWLSDDLLSAFTYCEGDTNIEVSGDLAGYKRLIASCHQFYTVEREGNSVMPDALPIATAAIDELSNDWKKFKLIDHTASSVIATSFSIDELWTIAEQWFADRPDNQGMLSLKARSGSATNFGRENLAQAKADDAWLRVYDMEPKPIPQELRRNIADTELQQPN